MCLCVRGPSLRAFNKIRTFVQGGDGASSRLERRPEGRALGAICKVEKKNTNGCYVRDGESDQYTGCARRVEYKRQRVERFSSNGNGTFTSTADLMTYLLFRVVVMKYFIFIVI